LDPLFFFIKALAFSGFIICHFTRRERGWKFLRSTLHIFLDLIGSFCSGMDAGTTAIEQKAETRTKKCFLAAPYGNGRPSSGDRKHCYAVYEVLGSFPFTGHCHGSWSVFPALGNCKPPCWILDIWNEIWENFISKSLYFCVLKLHKENK
jgi:hypothetical protein